MNYTNTPMGAAISNEDYKKRMAMLEKPWAEASVEEKLEKVREELIQLGYLTNRVNNQDLEIMKLKEHSHQDGKIVIPLTNHALNGLGGIGIESRRNNLS